MGEYPKPDASLKRTFRRRKQLEKDLEHVTQEMYKRNLELAETNQMLSLLRTIDALVLDSGESFEVICQQIAAAIAENSNFAVVALLSGPLDSHKFSLLGFSSAAYTLPPSAQERAYIELDTPWFNRDERYLRISDEHASTEAISEILHVTTNIARELRNKLHLHSVVVVKLISRQKLVGLMAVGLAGESISEKEQTQLDRLSEAIGIALDNKLLFEENQRVLKQLRTANEKLKALDETKDEFISMASHQLRTPLTAVKGYLSMVLEGDTGKVTPSQQKLLDQAFISAQRMVYLIADLLNVSRLRTGKFIIEPIETNLAEVVQGEVEQLKETAAGRELELTYHKPVNFPTLLLDETKIRQVIMNFIDNAIYYTQTGGHIQVFVEDKGESIEFRVVDDGLGVPKAEQHHLFTKFYRAGNAKKARPDGTGLGLFMAKKVVVAQGGSIIFSSIEGKGSTFGFSFAKAKLQPQTRETSQH